jgi:hypothetical protein
MKLNISKGFCTVLSEKAQRLLAKMKNQTNKKVVWDIATRWCLDAPHN